MLPFDFKRDVSIMRHIGLSSIMSDTQTTGTNSDRILRWTHPRSRVDKQGNEEGNSMTKTRVGNLKAQGKGNLIFSLSSSILKGKPIIRLNDAYFFREKKNNLEILQAVVTTPLAEYKRGHEAGGFSDSLHHSLPY